MEGLSKDDAWNNARAICCDECTGARGCVKCCQLLRTTASKLMMGQNIDLKKLSTTQASFV